MNNIDDRLTHNVTTEYKKGIYKTALAAEKIIEDRKKQSPPNSKKKSFESSKVLIKNCTERIIDFYMNILKL